MIILCIYYNKKMIKNTPFGIVNYGKLYNIRDYKKDQNPIKQNNDPTPEKSIIDLYNEVIKEKNINIIESADDSIMTGIFNS